MDPKEAEEDDVRGDENPVLVDENPVLADENPNYQTPADAALGNANDFQDAGGVAEYNQDDNSKLGRAETNFGDEGIAPENDGGIPAADNIGINENTDPEEESEDEEGSYMLNVDVFTEGLQEELARTVQAGEKLVEAETETEDDLVYIPEGIRMANTEFDTSVLFSQQPDQEREAGLMQEENDQEREAGLMLEENVLNDEQVNAQGPTFPPIAALAQPVQQEGAFPAHNEQHLLTVIIATELKSPVNQLTRIARKLLNSSNLSITQYRLEIPKSSVIEPLFNQTFLSEAERTVERINATAVVITFSEGMLLPMLVEGGVFNIDLRSRDGKFTLTGKEWKLFLAKNNHNLKIHDMVEVWAFRRNDNRLGLAIVKK